MAFNYSPKVVVDGLVLYLDAANPRSYPGSGTTWSDLSRGGNSGVLINGPTFNSANGGSIAFDGSNDSMNLGTILNFTTQSFSFSYWARFNSLTTSRAGQGPIVLYKGSFNVSGYYDQISTTGTVVFATNQSSANQGTITTSVITAGIWYNISYTRNGSSVIVYVNGIPPSQTPAVHVNPTSTTNNFTIASYQNGYIFGNFNLSSFVAYNRALSAQEVLQNYNATKSRFGLT